MDFHSICHGLVSSHLLSASRKFRTPTPNLVHAGTVGWGTAFDSRWCHWNFSL